MSLLIGKIYFSMSVLPDTMVQAGRLREYFPGVLIDTISSELTMLVIRIRLARQLFVIF